MNIAPLGPLELGLASILVLTLAGISYLFRLEIHKTLLVAALRTTIQLLMIGLVLKAVFASADFYLVFGIWLIMLVAAAREVISRQRVGIKGWAGYQIGISSMFVSSFSVMVLILVTVIKVEPWYNPRYAIPMLGMLLGNTMNGIALGMNNFSSQLWEKRFVIEQRLSLGQTSVQAVLDIWKESTRTGMIPIINAMAAAGLVSLPGMMTGQILAGNSAMDAVKYQILIMFMISAGTGFGVMLSLWLIQRNLFDERERLRLNEFFEIKEK